MVKPISVEKVKAQTVQPGSASVTKKKSFKKKSKIAKPKDASPTGTESPERHLMVKRKEKKEMPVESTFQDISADSIGDRYPVLRDEQLVKRFLGVPMNNNQKGRLRLQIKDKLKDTSDSILPDVIYNRIQGILKSSTNLTDTDLRKIRILYNMLTTALKTTSATGKKIPDKKKPRLKPVTREAKSEVKKEQKPQSEQKKKGKKRYVVFLGNLPLNIDKEKILNHFAELGDQIVDVRIPKRSEEKKSAIAYVELTNEPTFELALSKHHSMLGNRRINVLYTTQQNGKITKAEAKSKSAKLIALQKSGKLLGSIPANRKRSHRRMKMKQALAKQQQEQNA